MTKVKKGIMQMKRKKIGAKGKHLPFFVTPVNKTEANVPVL